MNYYEELEIEITATTDQIKKAFRKLAIRHHPDVGGDTEKFQRINQAYETLKDEAKRTQYDNSRRPPPQHHHFHPQDIFNGIFGNSRHFQRAFMQQMHQTPKRPVQKCEDESYTLSIPYEHVWTGYQKHLKKTVHKMCTTCVTLCTECSGQGIRVTRHILQGHQITPIVEPCVECHGSGLKFNKQPDCKCNLGQTVIQVDMQVVLPKHQIMKREIRLTDMGKHPTKGYEVPGDFIINFELELPVDTKVDMLGNITYSPTISIVQLITGATIDLPVLLQTDELKQVTVPPFKLKPDFMITYPNKGLYTNETQRANFFFKPSINYEVDTSLVKMNLLQQAFEDLQLQNGTLKTESDKQTE